MGKENFFFLQKFYTLVLQCRKNTQVKLELEIFSPILARKVRLPSFLYKNGMLKKGKDREDLLAHAPWLFRCAAALWVMMVKNVEFYSEEKMKSIIVLYLT